MTSRTERAFGRDTAAFPSVFPATFAMTARSLPRRK